MKRARVLLALVAFILSSGNYAQNTGPSAPEASSFEPVDATDMVSLITGDFSYVLPVIYVPGPGGGYPLALSYHAGIELDEEASWCGLGWNINPGAINRVVCDVPDDWKSKKEERIACDPTKTLSVFNVGIGIGNLPQIGYSWSNNKALYSGRINNGFINQSDGNTSVGIGGVNVPFDMDDLSSYLSGENKHFFKKDCKWSYHSAGI
ncbi:MAG: hypothetical protein ABIJ97_17700 [Bacteroidota bacterium]